MVLNSSTGIAIGLSQKEANLPQFEGTEVTVDCIRKADMHLIC